MLGRIRILYIGLAMIALNSLPERSVIQAADETLNYFDNLGSAHPDEILKVAPDVYQALPGVYRVHVYGTWKLDYPKEIEVDFEDLDADTEEFRKAVGLPASLPRTAVQWLLIASHPDRYLTASPERVRVESADGPMGIGTGYAIDRKGVLLTNRHVVESENDQAVKGDNILAYEPACVLAMIHELIAKLGKWSGSNFDGDMIQWELLNWCGENCKLTTQVTRIEVAVAYSKKNWLEQSSKQTAASIATGLFGFETRSPVLLPARIVAVGERKPDEAIPFENDIAILQIEGNVYDSLVCLPLAEPESLRPDLRVYSLGFPGYRYDFTNERTRDFLSVNLQEGAIRWFPGLKNEASLLDKRYRNLVIFDAKVRPGCSGGPAILSDGSVACMNVAHAAGFEMLAEEKQRADRIAGKKIFETDRPYVGLGVSLQRIRILLSEHGIDPDPGPTTAAWKAGLSAYRNRNYAEAARILQAIADKQVYRTQSGKPYEAQSTTPKQITCHYIAELVDLATNLAR